MKQVLSHFIEKRILISGAGGYIATNLIDLLKNVPCKIIRLSRRHELPPVNGIADIVDINGNVLEKETWDEALDGVDIVYHFAAQTSVPEADKNPLVDLEINVVPILHLLETSRQIASHPTVLFSSSVTVSGLPTRIPVDETHSDNPITTYDLHKLMAEQYLKHYINQKIVRGAALRLANVYGPGPKSSRSDRGILNQMVRNALDGKSLTVYGRGDQLRDYIYVEDVVRAFLTAYGNIDKINGKHFIIGSGRGYTITQALNLVADRVALKKVRRVEVTHIDPPSPQPLIESRNFVADISRFQRATGWEPRYALMQGIDKTIEVSL